MLDDEHIGRLLARATSMRAAVRALVDEANRAGGRDNITVVAFRVDAADAVDRRDRCRPGGSEGATLIGDQRRGGRPDRDRGAPPRRRRRGRQAPRGARRREAAPAPPAARAAKALAALVVIAAIVFGAWYGNRQVWFLGTDDAGRVALYRGLPYELPFGIKLYTEHYARPIQTEALPAKRRDAVTGHDLRSRGDAVSPARRNRTEPGAPLRSSARNRELVALVPVALLLTAGFAAVFAQEEVAARQPQPDLRRLLPRRLRRHPHLPADPAAQRRPLPVPAGRAADRLRAGDGLPDRRKPGPRPGQLVRPRPRPLRPDDPVPARLRGAGALPVHDRRGRPAAAAGAAPAGDRPAGQRRLPRGQDRPALLPAGRVLEDRDRRLPRQLPARAPRGADRRRPAGARGDAAAAQALRADAGRLGRLDVHARLHPRPRQLADVLRRLPRPALRRDRPLLLRRHRDGDVPRRRLVLRRHRPARPRPGRDLAAPLQRRARHRVPDPAVDLRPGRRRPLRQRLRPGADHDPRHPRGAAAGGPDRHDLLADRQRARPLRRLRA